MEADNAAEVISEQLEQISSLQAAREELVSKVSGLQQELEEERRKEPSPHPAEIALEQERERSLEAEARAEKAERLLAELQGRCPPDTVTVTLAANAEALAAAEAEARAAKAALEAQLLDKDLELEMQRADNEVMMKELRDLRRRLQEANL